jgi:MerR family transcriptional regulator, light-induced transcriptional regulator
VQDSEQTDMTAATRGGIPSGAAVRSLAREVVDRLSRVYAADPLPGDPAAVPREVILLCAALTGPDDARALGLARAALEDGMSFDDMCETRLAPAARYLGHLWEEDALSFADVSVAAHRLFGILRTLAHRPAPRGDAPFAVFAAVPGEEHVLGVTMAAERARGAGWDVTLLVGLGHDALVERISGLAPDAIGLSLSGPRTLLPLTRLVVALRVAVPASPLVVSGPGVLSIAAPIVGVDAMTPDFEGAMAALKSLGR